MDQHLHIWIDLFNLLIQNFVCNHNKLFKFLDQSIQQYQTTIFSPFPTITMLTLPTHLTLQHLFCPQRKLQTQLKKQSTLPKIIQPDETKQIKSMLQMIISQIDQQQFYDSEFVRIFLLIKINSLLAKECNINEEFVSALIKLYNSGKALHINKSSSDDQLFAQIILQAELYQHIKIQNVQNVLAGQCLLASTLAIMIKETQKFLKKAELTFALSFLALSGRPQAFAPIVHRQKNHKGQIYFANVIEQYIKLNQPEKYHRIDIESRKVQDPYSMRCAPQVYGVVYECLDFMKKDLDCILNKSHFRKLHIQGQQFDNIDLGADTEILKGDFLVCSLNEIGSMQFLRSQRVLNIYLGKNQLHKQNPKEVFVLKQVLQKTIHLVADNKLLSAPSNGDTMNIENYERDVYVAPHKVYEKFNKMLSNLYKVMLLEIQTAILGLENVYKVENGQVFQNKSVRDTFFSLRQNCAKVTRKQALYFIKEDWQMQSQQNNL